MFAAAPMNHLNVVLAHQYFGTSLASWLVAVLIVLAVTAGLALLRRLLVRQLSGWAERTPTVFDDVLVGVTRSLRSLFFLALGLWVASEYVVLSERSLHSLRVGVQLLTWLQLGMSLQVAVQRLAYRWGHRSDGDGEAKTMASAVGFIASLTIWALLSVLALSTLGFKISALVAGLGVGGVAAALAVQSILGDIFASLSIYFDRPFNLGDFIVVGSDMGTVERIGLRTTRVRALSGEEIVFANGDLTKSRIHNFKRMQDRRIQFAFGVDYGTSFEQLRDIPAIVRRAVEARPGTRFERAHFKEYGRYSLNFEVVYFVGSTDYNAYMDHQQAINLDIFRAFAERSIRFAAQEQRIILDAGPKPDALPR